MSTSSLPKRKFHTVYYVAALGLIVILLLILSAISLIILAPKYLSAVEYDKLQAAKTDISFFATALDAFDIDVGRYPTNQEGLNALLKNPNLPTWKGPYLKQLPKDPWGTPYNYRLTTDTHTPIRLSSDGPDKLPNTDDDITNYSTQ